MNEYSFNDYGDEKRKEGRIHLKNEKRNVGKNLKAASIWGF